jgi:hypothetical protein
MADLCARTQVVDAERKQRREQREHHQSEKPDLVVISFRGETRTKTVLYDAHT